jgi:pimeloyl-ACP methyl ester carboxylesterase
MIKMGRLIKGSLVIVIGVYLCVLAILYAKQDSLIFPAPQGQVDELPDYAEFAEFKTKDGTTLKHVRLKGDEGAPKIMFFHGNGSLAAFELERGRMLQENGFDVLLVEYRGYGGSDGEPSSEAIFADSLETFDWYNAEKSDWIFLYGHSLGTGVASHVAANRDVTSIALEAPFTRLSDLAASKHPIFPVKMLLKHEMDNVDALSSVSAPVIIIHGAKDEVVPIRFGEELYQTLDPEKAKFEPVENANHNSLAANGSLDRVLGFFSKSF